METSQKYKINSRVGEEMIKVHQPDFASKTVKGKCSSDFLSSLTTCSMFYGIILYSFSWLSCIKHHIKHATCSQGTGKIWGTLTINNWLARKIWLLNFYHLLSNLLINCFIYSDINQLQKVDQIYYLKLTWKWPWKCEHLTIPTVYINR